jgi:hypothetical protein
MNFALGTFSGLFLTGSIIGTYHAYPYSKKIMMESRTQNYPSKLLSCYGAFATTAGMSIGTGFMFALSPIIIPTMILHKMDYKFENKMEPIDIISISK